MDISVNIHKWRDTCVAAEHRICSQQPDSAKRPASKRKMNGRNQTLILPYALQHETAPHPPSKTVPAGPLAARSSSKTSGHPNGRPPASSGTCHGPTSTPPFMPTRSAPRPWRSRLSSPRRRRPQHSPLPCQRTVDPCRASPLRAARAISSADGLDQDQSSPVEVVAG